jgi:hypothetical protein
MMVASSEAPMLLVFGNMISTAPVSSSMPVTYRSHCPKPTAVNSASISGFPVSFAQEALTKTSASNAWTHHSRRPPGARWSPGG